MPLFNHGMICMSWARSGKTHGTQNVPWLLLQSLERPAGVFLDERIGMLREPLQDRPEFRQAGVAHRHRHVAQQTSVAGSLEGTAAEEFSELFFGQIRQPFE